MFTVRAKIHMEQTWKLNKALSIKLLLSLLSRINSWVDVANDNKDRSSWIFFHWYVVVSYVVSLRGYDGYLLDISGLNRHW